MIKYLFILCFIFYFNLFAQTSNSKQSDFRKRINEIETQYTHDDLTAEIKFGRELAAKVLGKYKQINDKKILNYVSKIGTGVASQFARPELNYYFTILDTNEVNAYACPGGYVFITMGAVKQMKSEAELVGVIAHELTHINNRHVVKQLDIKASGSDAFAGLASLTSGTSSTARLAFDQLVDNAAKILFEKGLEKKDEFESDLTAIDILKELNFDYLSYRNYIESFKKNVEKNTFEVISKTHPTVDERLKVIDKHIVANNLNTNLTTNKKNTKRFLNNVKY